MKKWDQKTSLEQFLCANPRDYHPEVFRLLQVRWQIFGTLTFAREYLRGLADSAAKEREHQIRTLIRRTLPKAGWRGKDLLFYSAMECGRAEQWHTHFLIAHPRAEHSDIAYAAGTMTALWHEIQHDAVGFARFTGFAAGCGSCRILPIDQNRPLDCVLYVCKKEYDAHGRERERLQYFSNGLHRELRRFAKGVELKGEEVMISDRKNLNINVFA